METRVLTARVSERIERQVVLLARLRSVTKQQIIIDGLDHVLQDAPEFQRVREILEMRDGKGK